MQKITCGWLSILLLSGCTASVSRAQRLGLDGFVGRPASYLVASFGPPRDVQSTQQGVDMTFVAKQAVVMSPEPGYVESGVNVRPEAWLDRRRCDFTFRVKNETIVGWSISGDACSGMQLPYRGMDVAVLAATHRSAAERTDASQSAPVLDNHVVEKGQFYQQ